ncbi:hypothetical protein GUITHDRAFT_121786 [Guillardia theta CCMP2712]|uniref:Uncharacterized protein n=1 Tax=Guillardia theta (strain CCMP2712) TaxID=905079 RepID=L1I726_GUITC|nr:hypothetical protein GUITHDRAFT_121786 [Guillardia theta CCMP2712]EKX32056.1 hypothetical protein GUITHDRAFT_121786 [Guillardia theta CCMP2712]|eukprot:XP_005819036.1 hypothetical protein GUITHDRAFT_121786 [Guillardia theta CCMP2712]
MGSDIKMAMEIHEAFSKTSIDLTKLKDNSGNNVFKTEEEMWGTLNPFFTTLERVRPGLRDVFMNILSLFPITEEDGVNLGSRLEKSLTSWEEHVDFDDDEGKFYTTIEWKGIVVGVFLRKNWPFKSIKRVEATVTDLKRCFDEFQEESQEPEDQENYQWLIDAEVTASGESRRARLRQRLPWDLTNDKTVQGIAALYKDVMEITEEINQFFKNRLTEIFPRALRLSGQEDYPLSGYLGFSYVKYWISLQFRNRTAPRNLIDRVKSLVSEAEVDDFEKLLDIPLEVCSLLKQLKRKEAISTGGTQEVVDLEKELVRSLLGKCKTSKIDEVSFLGRIQAAEGRLITMSEVQRRISNIYAEHKARRQYEGPTLRHKTANLGHAQTGATKHSDHPSSEPGSSGARHGRNNHEPGRGFQHGRHRGSDSRGGGWRDSQSLPDGNPIRPMVTLIGEDNGEIPHAADRKNSKRCRREKKATAAAKELHHTGNTMGEVASIQEGREPIVGDEGGCNQVAEDDESTGRAL